MIGIGSNTRIFLYQGAVDSKRPAKPCIFRTARRQPARARRRQYCYGLSAGCGFSQLGGSRDSSSEVFIDGRRRMTSSM